VIASTSLWNFDHLLHACLEACHRQQAAAGMNKLDEAGM
jgi:hypothetical protein